MIKKAQSHPFKCSTSFFGGGCSKRKIIMCLVSNKDSLLHLKSLIKKVYHEEVKPAIEKKEHLVSIWQSHFMRNKKQFIIHNIYRIIQLYKLKMTFFFFVTCIVTITHLRKK